MKEIEIPFGAFDSELQGFEYTIPDGYTAEIVDGKIIVKKEESEDGKLSKKLHECVCMAINNDKLPYEERKHISEQVIPYLEKLEKQKEQKSAWSEEDEQMLHKALSTIRYALSIPIDKEDEPCFVGSSTISWLKSLKDRIAITNKNDFDRGYDVGISAAKFNQWKPTREQLGALSEVWLACENPKTSTLLNSLYDDLKKL